MRGCPSLLVSIVDSRQEGKGRGTYVGADFGGCIPYSNHLHITGYQGFTLSLLPVENQSSVPVTRDEFRQSPKGRDDLSLPGRFVVAKHLENPIRGPRHQERLVILINIPDLINLRSRGISIREPIQPLMTLPVPDSNSIPIIRNSEMILELMETHPQRLTAIRKKRDRVIPPITTRLGFQRLRLRDNPLVATSSP